MSIALLSRRNAARMGCGDAARLLPHRPTQKEWRNTIHHLQFIMYYLPFTIYHLLFTIYCLPFTIYHLLFTKYAVALLYIEYAVALIY